MTFSNTGMRSNPAPVNQSEIAAGRDPSPINADNLLNFDRSKNTDLDTASLTNHSAIASLQNENTVAILEDVDSKKTPKINIVAYKKGNWNWKTGQKMHKYLLEKAQSIFPQDGEKLTKTQIATNIAKAAGAGIASPLIGAGYGVKILGDSFVRIVGNSKNFIELADDSPIYKNNNQKDEKALFLDSMQKGLDKYLDKYNENNKKKQIDKNNVLAMYLSLPSQSLIVKFLGADICKFTIVALVPDEKGEPFYEIENDKDSAKKDENGEVTLFKVKRNKDGKPKTDESGKIIYDIRTAVLFSQQLDPDDPSCPFNEAMGIVTDWEYFDDNLKERFTAGCSNDLDDKVKNERRKIPSDNVEKPKETYSDSTSVNIKNNTPTSNNCWLHAGFLKDSRIDLALKEYNNKDEKSKNEILSKANGNKCYEIFNCLLELSNKSEIEQDKIIEKYAASIRKEIGKKNKGTEIYHDKKDAFEEITDRVFNFVKEQKLIELDTFKEIKNGTYAGNWYSLFNRPYSHQIKQDSFYISFSIPSNLDSFDFKTFVDSGDHPQLEEKHKIQEENKDVCITNTKYEFTKKPTTISYRFNLGKENQRIENVPSSLKIEKTTKAGGDKILHTLKTDENKGE